MLTIAKMFQFATTKVHQPITIITNEFVLDEHYAQAIIDLEKRTIARAARLTVLLKRRTYFNYFNVRKRYGLTFKNFNYKVDNGLWAELVADK